MNAPLSSSDQKPPNQNDDAKHSALYRQARRVAILILGGSVLLVGIAMLALPGPAFIVIPTGLGILALEFAWAKRILRRIKRTARRAKDSILGSGEKAPPAV